jgi:hypothetical protein
VRKRARERERESERDRERETGRHTGIQRTCVCEGERDMCDVDVDSEPLAAQARKCTHDIGRQQAAPISWAK